MREGPSATGCPFCSIGRGEDRETEVLCDAEDWVAFFPLNPATPGHTLVIPRHHVQDLWTLDEPSLAADLMNAVIFVGKAIQQAMQPQGMNLITSAGTPAEQTVFHLHLHLVPRWERDGFGQIWPAAGRFEDSSLSDYASRIRQSLSQDSDSSQVISIKEPR